MPKLYFCPPTLVEGDLKWVRPSEIPSVRRHNEMGSLWTQFLLQFLTDLFETLQVFLSWSEDVHQVLGLSSLHFFFNFFHFLDLVFFRSDYYRNRYLVGATLEFSTDHFETMDACSTWSVDVHLVLGLSSHYFYHLFLLFLGSISIRIDTVYLVGATPPRVFHRGSISIRIDMVYLVVATSFPPIIFKLCVLVLHHL